MRSLTLTAICCSCSVRLPLLIFLSQAFWFCFSVGRCLKVETLDRRTGGLFGLACGSVIQNTAHNLVLGLLCYCLAERKIARLRLRLTPRGCLNVSAR